MTPLQWHEKRLKNETSIHSEILLDKTRQNPIRVSDLMNWGFNSKVGSPATLHKAIQSLLQKEYLKIVRDSSDARNKTLVITKDGINYLEK